jgi:undecaprenyl-diphosphatase
VLDYLNVVDTIVFRFINVSLSNPVFDIVMPFLTDLNKQRIVLVIVATLLLWMIIRGNRSVRLAAILLIVTIIISDQLNSSVIKYWSLRQRPCHILDNVRLLVSCGSGYSFPSSHAVNNFAGAIILAFFLPRAKWWFFGLAATIAFSRVYVGVHYPCDVIGGGVIGLMCGGCVLYVFLGFENIWYRKMHRRVQKGNS